VMFAHRLGCDAQRHTGAVHAGLAGHASACGRLVAIVEGSDVDDPPSPQGQYLPPVCLAALLNGSRSTSHLETNQQLLGADDHLRDRCTHSLVATALVPGEHFVAVVTAGRWVIG